MPLHLLGKKSWHVYNTANVERVRRDEADAQAREEAEEQRMQEEDASRRIAILRGEKPAAADAALPLPPSATEEAAGTRHDHDHPRERKRRRLRDEDDTAREIRYAREDAEEAEGQQARRALEHTHAIDIQTRDADAPLVDHAGHLQLFPVPEEKASSRKAGKNAEVEAEKAKKRKREEDQVTMRFSNAAGYQQGLQKPWYASNKHAKPDSASASNAAEDGAQVLTEIQEKDVWGNDDPRPMQNAQRQLKQSTRDKETWELERQRELEKLQQEQHREKRRRRHHHRKLGAREEDDLASLDDFSLDATTKVKSEQKSENQHRRRRSRSRSFERYSHRRS
ncbi:hypothetical protein LTR86_006817 [Recurvomyces mirabilis]|nr:hypothetical protein LTR86_006817 [Recurvomyces mirabilis]